MTKYESVCNVSGVHQPIVEHEPELVVFYWNKYLDLADSSPKRERKKTLLIIWSCSSCGAAEKMEEPQLATQQLIVPNKHIVCFRFGSHRGCEVRLSLHIRPNTWSILWLCFTILCEHSRSFEITTGWSPERVTYIYSFNRILLLYIWKYSGLVGLVHVQAKVLLQHTLASGSHSKSTSVTRTANSITFSRRKINEWWRSIIGLLTDRRKPQPHSQYGQMTEIL